MNYQQPQPYMYQQQFTAPAVYVPKTAINELDSFMAGLTEEDRGTIFSTPAFGGLYTDFLNKFMFYLLQGELGAEFISASPQRRDHAEQLKLMAHDIYSENKKSTTSKIEALKQENEKLLAALGKKGKGDA